MSCCVSYTYTASCVATAYTIRYGNANAVGGVVFSFSPGLGEEVGRLDSLRIDSEWASGGGSINDECDIMAASGSGGIASP